jgi:hypothetical protein
MMIRFIVGLLIVMGAMGGMDDPANPLLPLTLTAIVGLVLMYFGSNKLKGQ